MSKEAGTWEVDLKSSIGLGSNFTLSPHTLFLSAAVRLRYGNASNVGARGGYAAWSPLLQAWVSLCTGLAVNATSGPTEE